MTCMYRRWYLQSLCCRSLQVRRCSNESILTKEAPTPLTRQLQTQIKATGPLTVAQFMRQALTHPQYGYYMKRDVFGQQGDFVTSPEVSQMFGELLGVWLIAQWQQQQQISTNSSSGIRLIELGPGRGTLMSIYYISKRFPAFRQAITGIHLIEVSPELRQIQRGRLCSASSSLESNAVHGTENIPVYWHDTFTDWTKNDTFSNDKPWIIAHEFLDALPIQIFEKTGYGWREVLVDIDASNTSAQHFRLVLAPSVTPNVQLFASNANYARLPIGSRIEVSPDEREGLALLVDYGNDFNKPNTLRGIRHHQFYDPLSQPGDTDLSVDVDFSWVRQATHDLVNVFGPITQRDFLHRMGIETRLSMLQKRASVEQRALLSSAYQRLTDPVAMGTTYKFMALTPKSTDSDVKSSIPIAFE
ncbi:S-adenosyl-L-methionine-dependent methyltransferase [Syncephalis fuscata]|nr:S-adenosyl-L-methionine-dependent methyltransferase [Syncephalis fuscata]